MSRMNGWKKLCAVLVVCAASEMSVAAQTFTNVYSFSGADGANPYAGLVQGPDGNLYGTTIDGGANGSGNVFRITTSGKLTSLYDFCAQANCADGQYPVSTLVMGRDGDFYGTTQNGGIYNLFYGTIFKISSNGVLTTLHSFNSSDGVNPYGALLLASNGNFYGTANQAGNCRSGGGCGTVFTMTPSGAFRTLYNFCQQTGCPDGEFPVGGLVEGSDGNIYGTTNAGGNPACPGGGCGTIFRITPGGVLTTLHRFNNTDGSYPAPALIEAHKGLFYGTTAGGGANGNGTVFAMTADGVLATVYSFNGTDGGGPFVLIAGSDGNLYGTTLGGGPDNDGTVYKITPAGTLTTLHTFGGSFYYYFGSLTQATNGTFYGTTYFGGPADDGTIYSLSIGLKPFVKVQPSAGKIGGTVSILGNNLSRVTRVTFNGTPATFQVVSKTLITATVPPGALSGRVDVRGAGFGLRSNVPFVVVP
ncbi:MAG TPA: choice-of-anchor tandem repeat GloVer-containing protein [Terriglobales bacterium]|nr:choice-of-anchor tandem repeat GloVer-containing protein [Terriglobales bacterium]